MKIVLRTFLWVAIAYHGLPLLVLLASSWAPLYLMAAKGAAYNWPAYVGSIFYLSIGLFVSIVIYRYLQKRVPSIPTEKVVALGVLLAVYLALSIIWANGIIWVHAIFAITIATILVAYPRVITSITHGNR